MERKTAALHTGSVISFQFYYTSLTPALAVTVAVIVAAGFGTQSQLKLLARRIELTVLIG